MVVQNKKILLQYAPDFCYLSEVDLFLMVEAIDENADWESFRITLHKMKKEGLFKTKASRYCVKLKMSDPISKTYKRAPLYIRVNNADKNKPEMDAGNG